MNCLRTIAIHAKARFIAHQYIGSTLHLVPQANKSKLTASKNKFGGFFKNCLAALI
jgi:hypothetical protein